MILFSTPPLSLSHIQHSDLKGVKVGELEIIQERLNIKKDRETVLVNAHKVQGRKDGLFFFSCGRIGLRMKRSGIDPPPFTLSNPSLACKKMAKRNHDSHDDQR